jgi:N-acyl-D-aspartate/D-glutamate deacylase
MTAVKTATITRKSLSGKEAMNARSLLAAPGFLDMHLAGHAL